MRKIIKSARETKKLGALIAKTVINSKPGKHAKVFGLIGDLGSGKTTFIQGFIKMFAGKQRVTSPTFLIFKPYAIKKTFKSHRKVYHVDLYRIHSRKDLAILGFKNILKNPHNIVLIEWAGKIKTLLPKNTIWLHFKHGRNRNERIIKTKLINNEIQF